MSSVAPATGRTGAAQIMKILLADDHQIVREGLKVALAKLAGCVEIFEAACIEEVLSQISAIDDLDLIILDLRMPGMHGLAGLEQVRGTRPEVPVAILSASVDRRDIEEALALGASGYIPKSLTLQQTVAALEHILAGGSYSPAPPAADQELGESLTQFANLSPRERHVLALLAEGCSNKEIARRLALQEVTVKAHLRQVFRKLSVSNRTQAVKLVLERGRNP